MIAFGGNLRSGKPCHRDAQQGVDLFLGDLDLQTGQVSNLRVADDGVGAQWSPTLSSDGRYLAWNVTQGQQSAIVLQDLTTGRKETITTNARFPAFSRTDRKMWFNRPHQKALYWWDMTDGSIHETSTAHDVVDPSPVGSEFLAFHYAMEDHTAYPVIRNLATGEEKVYEVARAGHVAANPSGTRIVANQANSMSLFLSTRDGSTWSDFTPLAGDFEATVRSLEPTLAGGGPLFFSFAGWASDDHLLVTVMGSSAGAGQGVRKTTSGDLFLVDLSADTPRFVPLTFPEVQAGFDIQTLTADAVAGFSAASTALPPLGSTATSTTPASVYINTTARNKDPSHPGTPDYRTDAAAYNAYREGILRLSRTLEEKQVPWNFQPDWTFLEAVKQREVVTKDEALLSATGGLNVVAYLAAHGAEVNPYSHEKGGYNYADVAWLIQDLGVEPAPVVGGHVWDPAEPGYGNWPRFIQGITGQRYPGMTWKPTILMDAASFQHTADTLVSGMWHPRSASDFYADDPSAPMTAIGNMRANATTVQDLLSRIDAGTLPRDAMYTALLNFQGANLSEDSYFQRNVQGILSGLLALRGRVEFVTATEAVEIWQSQFGEKGYIYQDTSEAGDRRGPPGARKKEGAPPPKAKDPKRAGPREGGPKGRPNKPRGPKPGGRDR